MSVNYFRMTKPQKNIMQAYRFHGESYPNVGGVLLYKGELDVGLMKKTINIALQHNSSIRIRLKNQFPEDVIYIADYECYEADYIDLSEDENRDDKINKMLSVPFEIYGHSLIEFKSIRYDSERMGFFLRAHHVLADGFSVGLLISQFIEIYNSLAERREMKIKESNFIDFAKLEDEYTASPRYIIDKKFWEERLHGGFSKIGRDVKTRRSNRIAFKIDPDQTENIKKVCEENHITVPVFFQAIILFYLACINDGTNLPSMAVSALGRTQKSKYYIGNLVLSLPLAVCIDENDTFETLCANIKGETFRIYKHQQYAEACTDSSGSLEMLFSFQSGSVDNIGGYETIWYSGGFAEAKFFLTIDTRDDPNRFAVTVDYRAEAFEQGEAELILKRLGHIANQVMLDFKIPLRTVDIIPEEEKNFLNRFNDTDCPLPDKKISEYITESTNRNPDKTIYICNGEEISFACAEKKVNYLARLLVEKGFRRGNRVALVSERSVAFMLAVRAVVKAGCAFMPVEKSTPPARLEYMLKNSGARLFDIPTNIGEEECFEDVSCINDPCYIMYTSGSTGMPKGVAVSQRALINRIVRMNELSPLSGEDVILHKTSLSFDVSVWELFWGPMFGAVTSILPSGDEKLPDKLIECIRQTNVTRLHFVPSMLTVFLGYAAANAAAEALSTVKYVYASGEALRNVEQFKDVFKAKLYNFYGPTECAIDVTYHEVNDFSDIPIGRPFGNNRIYILDSLGRLCPVGVKGELCIGGIQVSNGYLNNDELTRQAFVEYGDEIIYKTGDTAYINVKGELVFVGRRDDQVKINGRRVQLSEIEAQICALEGISFSAVSYIDGYLCGWFVSDKKASVPELKQQLLRHLPHYMVPESLTQLDEISLLPNGKLDRSRLIPQIYCKTSLSEPETKEQAAFVSAVEETFRKKGVEINVGIDDNLLELGLDSLSIISISIIPELEGISIEDIYVNQTIRNILSLKKQAEPLNILKRAGAEKAVVYVPYAGGNCWSFKEAADNLDADVYAVEPSAFDKNETYEDSAAKIVDMLPNYKSFDIVGYCVGSGLAAHVAYLAEKKGKSISRLILFGMTLPPLMHIWGRYFSVWDAVPKKLIMRILNRAHGKNIGFTQQMLGKFRAGTKYFFSNMPFELKGINAEILCVYGKEDIFTKWYSRSHKKWEHFFGKEIKYIEVDTDNHFFGLESSSIMPQIINTSPIQPGK